MESYIFSSFEYSLIQLDVRFESSAKKGKIKLNCFAIIFESGLGEQYISLLFSQKIEIESFPAPAPDQVSLWTALNFDMKTGNPESLLQSVRLDKIYAFTYHYYGKNTFKYLTGRGEGVEKHKILWRPRFSGVYFYLTWGSNLLFHSMPV